MKARPSVAAIVALRCTYLLIVFNPQNVSAGQPTCQPPSSRVVKVKVELTNTGAAVARKLAPAGFKVETRKGSLQLTGSILTYRLKQLVQIVEVKSVSLNQ